MDLDEQTRSLLQDNLLLNEVPLRFFAELYADVNNAGDVEDELNLDRVTDQTEPCVKSANYECLAELYDLLDQRLNCNDPQDFWSFLNAQGGGGQEGSGKRASKSPATGARNRTVRHLVALLIKVASLADPASPDGCSRGLIAAACYVRLLRVKGSRAYGAFSSLALQSVIRLLKQYPKLLGCVALQEGEEDDRDAEGDSGNDMDVVTESNSTGCHPKDASGRNLVARWFGKTLKELELLLKEVPLSECKDVVLQLSEFLGELSGAVIEFKKYGDKAALQRFRQISYNCMLLLLDPKHGAVLDTVSQIYKALLGNILMTVGTRNGSHASATKDTIAASQMAVDYVRNSINAITLLKFGNLQHSGDGQETSEPTENAEQETEQATPKPALNKAVILLQQICIRIPDKADYRARGVQVVRDILEHLPHDQQSSFMTWLQKYSRNVKAAYRGFALDVIAGLVGGMEHDEDVSEDMIAERRPVSSVLAASSTEMVWLLAGRGADKSPTVRARAVGLLAKIMERGVSDENSPSAHLAIEFLHNLNRTLPSNITVIQMILNRSEDDKSVVRKATLCLVKALISLEIYQLHHGSNNPAPVTTLPLTGKLLPLFGDRSRDPVMSVRKSVITMLADLLEDCPELPELWSLWIQCVPPMALDRESAVQEEAGSCTFRIFIDPLTPEKRKHCKSMFNALVEFDDSLERCFRRLLYLGSKKKSIKSYSAKLLQKIALEDITLEGPWRLLAEISCYCADALDAKAMVGAWEALQNSLQQANWRICTHVLNIIGYIGKLINKADAKLLQEQFVANLSTFEVSPTLISSMINTIQKLEISENVIGWCAQLLTTCEKLLTRCVLERNTDETGTDMRLDRYLYTAAAVAQLSPSDIPEKLVTAIQALVASDSEQQNISPSVRAQAFVSLGKLCLQNEDYAKRLVSAFARELEVSKDVVVRNNVMVVMCDLCIRYTRLVDPYIPKIACCLRDESKLVRRQTLTMLTRLLQEDYVKWKATLFFKFVTTVVDEDPDIVEFAEFCLCQVLQVKHPAMFFTFFVDTVLFLNGCNDRVTTTGFSKHDQELFVMSGQGENERKRHRIYTFLLQNMLDEHRFQLTAKLCVDILGGVVDDAIDIRDPNRAAVLVDALYVLSSKDIKISTKPLKDAGDGTEIEDAVNTIAAKARTKILSKISRKNTIENMLPVIIELKRRLERDRSPLLKQLMICLREVVRDFRVEMEDITAGDRRLANEIEFDLRQFELQQQQQQRQVMAPPAPLTPRAMRKKGTPVGTPVIAPLVRNHKTPLPKMIGTPAKPTPGQQPFSVPKLRTVSQNAKIMSNTSTPSRPGRLSTPAGLALDAESFSSGARLMDISGFGGPITPICGTRRETFSTVILDTPGWSPEVVNNRQVLKENPTQANGNLVPSSPGPLQRSKEMSTPARPASASASASASALRVMRQGQTTWNVTSPLSKSRLTNWRKRAVRPADGDYEDEVEEENVS